MRRRPEGRSGAAVARYSISILAAPSTSEQSPLCSDVLLFLRAKRTSSARFLALPLQIDPSALGFDLWPPCGRRFSFFIKNIAFNRSFQKEGKTSAESRCLSSFWVFLDPSPPSQLFPHPQYAQIYLPNQKNPAAQPVLAMPLDSLLPDFLIHQFVQFLDVSGLIGNSVVGLFGI